MLTINEFMASNTTVFPDEDGEFQDWIEIYNGGDAAIDLDQYGLSDDVALPFKWRFPSVTLNPDSYLVVFASDKNRLSLPLHLNWKISSAGEPLVLTRPDGFTVDQVPATALTPNVSFGRKPDGSATFQTFSTSTPGQTNNSGSSVFVSPPAFLLPGGFYVTTQTLALSATLPGAEIRYTLDGSDPSATSPLYSAPLQIADRSSEPIQFANIRTTGTQTANGIVPWLPPVGNVYKGTIVRARQFSAGISSTVDSQAYFVSPDALTRYAGLPVASIIIATKDLFSAAEGLYVLGPDPGTTVPYVSANFQQSWEKPGKFEYFTPSRQRVLNQQVGVRIQGDFSRAQPMKSLRLYSQPATGVSGFNHPLFASKPISNFQRLVLRNGGNDFWLTMMRDEVIQLGAPPTVLNQAYRPVAVFVNGEFWGLHNLRERIDEYFLNNNTGVDINNVDLLEINDPTVEVDAGDAAHWNTLVGFVQTATLSSPADYATLQTLIDLPNFTDYILMNVWADNEDWPSKNVRVWHPRSAGGRWQWISFGAEASLGFPSWSDVSFDTLDFVNTDAATEIPRLLRKLFENPAYRTYFARRASSLVSGTYSAETVLRRIDALEAGMQHIMPEHIARWQYPANLGEWRDNINVVRDFSRQRPAIMLAHINTRLGLGGLITATVNIDPPGAALISTNDVMTTPIAGGIWQGQFYKNLPLTVAVAPHPGYVFQGWTLTPSGADVTGNSLSLNPAGNITMTARFTGAPIATATPAPNPRLTKTVYLPLSRR